MRRTIKFDKNEKNSAFAKEKTLNQKKDNQNLADKYQNNNVILNKETYNLIKAQGKIDNEGAKFSHNNVNLENKRYSNNEDNCLYGSEKESLLESYRFINSGKIKLKFLKTISPFDVKSLKAKSLVNEFGLSLINFVYERHLSSLVIVFSKFENELRNSIISS